MNLKNMRECDKSKNTCKQQLPIVYMSFNNDGHLITSTITTLQHHQYTATASLHCNIWESFTVLFTKYVF